MRNTRNVKVHKYTRKTTQRERERDQKLTLYKASN